MRRTKYLCTDFMHMYGLLIYGLLMYGLLIYGLLISAATAPTK